MSDERRNVIVVGGGVVGLSSAWFLQRAGCSVTLLAREPVGVGASSGNGGMIVPSHVVPLSAPGVIAQGLRWLANPESPFHIKPRVDADLIRWLLRFRASCTDRHVAYAAPILAELCLTSADLFTEMQAAAGDFAWSRTGLMMVYRSEKYRKDNDKAADVAESVGLRVQRLDEAGTRKLEPGIRSDVLGSVLYEDDGRVDPDAFLRVMAERLRAEGVRIEENVTVKEFGASGAGVSVVTDRGEHAADTAVLAAGAWSGRLASRLGARVPIQPAKGYSITVPSREDGPKIPMILSEDKITITPMPGRIRFGGTLSLAGFDVSVDPRRYAPIRAQALRYNPDLDPATVDATVAWSGFRPASPDGLPMIGRLAANPRVVVAAGHGMMGVTLGPVTGRLVADIVTGTTPIVDARPFDPGRF